jgi:hypothetical protein
MVETGSDRAEAALRLAPHFLQNLAPRLTEALQAGQISSSLRPHCSQKVASAGLSLPHLLHSIKSPIARARLWPLSDRATRSLR